MARKMSGGNAAPIQTIMSMEQFHLITQNPLARSFGDRYQNNEELFHIETYLQRYHNLMLRPMTDEVFSSLQQTLFNLERNCHLWFLKHPIHSEITVPLSPYTHGVLQLMDEVDEAYGELLAKYKSIKKSQPSFGFGFTNWSEHFWLPDNPDLFGLHEEGLDSSTQSQENFTVVTRPSEKHGEQLSQKDYHRNQLGQLWNDRGNNTRLKLFNSTSPIHWPSEKDDDFTSTYYPDLEISGTLERSGTSNASKRPSVKPRSLRGEFDLSFVNPEDAQTRSLGAHSFSRKPRKKLVSESSVNAEAPPKYVALNYRLAREPELQLDDSFMCQLDVFHMKLMMTPTGRELLDQLMDSSNKSNDSTYFFHRNAVHVFGHDINDHTAFLSHSDYPVDQVEEEPQPEATEGLMRKLWNKFKRKRTNRRQTAPYSDSKQAMDTMGERYLGSDGDILEVWVPTAIRKDSEYFAKGADWDQQRNRGHYTLMPKVIEYARALLEALIKLKGFTFPSLEDYFRFIDFIENQLRSEMGIAPKVVSSETGYFSNTLAAKKEVMGLRRLYGEARTERYLHALDIAEREMIDEEQLQEIEQCEYIKVEAPKHCKPKDYFPHFDEDIQKWCIPSIYNRRSRHREATTEASVTELIYLLGGNFQVANPKDITYSSEFEMSNVSSGFMRSASPKMPERFDFEIIASQSSEDEVQQSMPVTGMERERVNSQAKKRSMKDSLTRSFDIIPAPRPRSKRVPTSHKDTESTLEPIDVPDVPVKELEPAPPVVLPVSPPSERANANHLLAKASYLWKATPQDDFIEQAKHYLENYEQLVLDHERNQSNDPGFKGAFARKAKEEFLRNEQTLLHHRFAFVDELEHFVYQWIAGNIVIEDEQSRDIGNAVRLLELLREEHQHLTRILLKRKIIPWIQDGDAEQASLWWKDFLSKETSLRIEHYNSDETPSYFEDFPIEIQSKLLKLWSRRFGRRFLRHFKQDQPHTRIIPITNPDKIEVKDDLRYNLEGMDIPFNPDAPFPEVSKVRAAESRVHYPKDGPMTEVRLGYGQDWIATPMSSDEKEQKRTELMEKLGGDYNEKNYPEGYWSKLSGKTLVVIPDFIALAHELGHAQGHAKGIDRRFMHADSYQEDHDLFLWANNEEHYMITQIEHPLMKEHELPARKWHRFSNYKLKDFIRTS
ncbi:hypothetical protein [Aureibacter tunicatorum]|uniref:Uncharacterized protein n=1 Tax=Aureibacter tunicatorum TaxID=866807 RepID=A0AAE4BSM4_9BACT|nr:hypothetical protein [Aureibacter tunicatorum]MDR6241374.1 hypothetical protein [Aureibacter tunicatorum]